MPHLHRPDSIGRNALVVFAGQLATWLISALTFAIVPRYLGAHDVGIYSLGLTVGALAGAFAGLGMGTLITRDIARDPGSAGNILGTAAVLSIGLGVVGGALAVGGAWMAGYSGIVLGVIALNSAIVPCSLLGTILGSAFQGLEIMRWSVMIDISLKTMLLVGAGVAIVLDLGLLGMAVVSASGSIVACLLQVLVATSVFRFPLWKVSGSLAKSLLARSVPFFAISALWILYTSVDVLLLSKLSGSDSVGIYSTPMRLFGTMLFIPVTITTVLFPRLSAAHVQDTGYMARVSARTLAATVTISFLMAIAGVGLSDRMFVSLLGDSFAEHTGAVVVALSISIVPTSINVVAARMALASDRQSAISWIGGWALLGKVVLALALIPTFDSALGNAALGAAVGMVVTEAAMAVAMLKLLPAGSIANEASHFYRRLFGAAAVAATVVGAGYAATPVGAAMAGAVTFVGLLFALGLYAPGQLRGVVRWLASRTAEPVAAR